jgi:hypothetical protein
MGRKTLWVSPFFLFLFLFFPIERTDRSFPAEKKKEIIFFFVLFLSYCCVVSTSHAINVVYGIARRLRQSVPHGVVIRPAHKNPSKPPYLHAIKSLDETRPPHSSSRLIERAPLLFVVLRYPLPRLRYARRDGPSLSRSLSSRSILSIIIIIIIIIIIFLLKRSFFLPSFFFLLSLWFVLPAFLL